VSALSSSKSSLHARVHVAIRALCVLAVLAASLAFVPSALADETGQIAGTVTLPSGGLSEYVTDVNVCAYTLSGTLSACGNPGPSGEYAIEGLAGGEYKVGFFSTGLGYLPQYFDDKVSLAEAESVSVITGQTTSEVNATLSPAGEITGRVTNAATNAPIQGIEACVSETIDGTRWEKCGSSNANGEYTISELASGQYQVVFRPDGLDYFFSSIQAVSVTAGHVTSGVDAALTEGGRMTGRITDAATGEPVEEAEACAREVRGDEEQCGTANANGEYTILRLPSGEYHVEFRSRVSHYLPGFYGGKFTASEASPVSVTAPGTTSGIDGALQPGVFEEPANTSSPAISGTPSVGDVLSCSPGSWTGNPAPTFTYIWLRGGARITGASESSYTAQSADEGQSVSCEVLATSAAGNMFGIASSASASVLVAASSSIEAPVASQPATVTMSAPTGLAPSVTTMPLITLMASEVVVSGGTAPVGVECQAAACRGSIELTAEVPAKNGKGETAADHEATVVLATGSFSFAEGKHGTVVLHLTAAGKKRLAHASKHHPIAVKLTLSVQSGKTVTRSVLVG
jgi:Carboxypeptidase regulatory-like domain